jgi:hypothetical protein
MDQAEDRSGMVQVDLTQEEWEQRSDKLAAEEIEREQVRADKRSHNSACNDRIRELNKSIRQLSEEVSTRKAWVPAQTDMFGGDDEPAVNDDGEEAEAEPQEPTPRRRRRRSAATTNGLDAA